MRRSAFLVMALCAAVVIAASSLIIAAQGQLELSGRVRIAGKQEKLTRKRFYLIPGSLKDNAALIARVRDAEIRSRDCYYSSLNASPEYICWLQVENCESPFCRVVKKEEIASVPEFKLAHQKGMTQFRGKDDVARTWITTNMPSALTDGFYLERRSLTEKLLGGIKPLQSSMTDSVSVKALFIDIPLVKDKKSTPFVISNIVPIEFGGKSYLWACEVDITQDKVAKLNLVVPEADKPVRNCEVIVKDLTVCKTGQCKAK
jgi:hypothetical protein